MALRSVQCGRLTICTGERYAQSALAAQITLLGDGASIAAAAGARWSLLMRSSGPKSSNDPEHQSALAILRR